MAIGFSQQSDRPGIRLVPWSIGMSPDYSGLKYVWTAISQRIFMEKRVSLKMDKKLHRAMGVCFVFISSKRLEYNSVLMRRKRLNIQRLGIGVSVYRE